MRWLWDLAVDIPRGSPSLKSWFLWREENQRTRRKICVARTKTNNKLNPHVTPGLGNKPGPQRWESSTLTTAPSQLLQKETEFLTNCLRYNCY